MDANKEKQVVGPGEFNVGVTALDHSHINGMVKGMVEAGATVKYVYDPNEMKVRSFLEQFPEVEVAASLEQILTDDAIHLVAAAAVPNLRSALGDRVMRAGKDYFTDKTAFTTLEQLETTKQVVKETGQKLFVYFNERFNVEGALYAGQLVEEGRIGEVIQITGFGPHRLRKESRPDWFFHREQTGGILTDIGCHQIEQFLYLTGNKDARVVHSQVGNYANPDTPEFEDYGDATLIGENGATLSFNVHWFTPDGLPTWGDGRTFITGTKGTIEVRKYINVGQDDAGNHVYLVDEKGIEHLKVTSEIGSPFYGQMILDCLHRTEYAMRQDHLFKTFELSLMAQQQAIKINMK